MFSKPWLLFPWLATRLCLMSAIVPRTCVRSAPPSPPRPVSQSSSCRTVCPRRASSMPLPRAPLSPATWPTWRGWASGARDHLSESSQTSSLPSRRGEKMFALSLLFLSLISIELNFSYIGFREPPHRQLKIEKTNGVSLKLFINNSIWYKLKTIIGRYKILHAIARYGLGRKVWSVF